MNGCYKQHGYFFGGLPMTCWVNATLSRCTVPDERRSHRIIGGIPWLLEHQCIYISVRINCTYICLCVWYLKEIFIHLSNKTSKKSFETFACSTDCWPIVGSFWGSLGQRLRWEWYCWEMLGTERDLSNLEGKQLIVWIELGLCWQMVRQRAHFLLWVNVG